MEYLFSIKIDSSVVKKLDEASELSGIDNNESLLNELLDEYLLKNQVPNKTLSVSDVTSSSLSEAGEKVETEYEYVVGGTYFGAWSKGEKNVAVKYYGKNSVEVLPGSDFNPTSVNSLGDDRVKMREQLLRDGYIVNGKTIKEVTFNSLSAAASVMRGAQVSGPEFFKKK